jgi:hypothetical protein
MKVVRERVSDLEGGVVAGVDAGVVLQELVGEGVLGGVDLHQLLLRPLRRVRVRPPGKVGHLARAPGHAVLALHGLDSEHVREAQEVRRHVPHLLQGRGDGLLHHAVPWHGRRHRCPSRVHHGRIIRWLHPCFCRHLNNFTTNTRIH